MSGRLVRLLVIDAARQRYFLRTLRAGNVSHDPRDDYTLLGGEVLCQFILREDPGALVMARGPLPFLAGNKTTVGYVSPLTGLPHYSFVGGRGFAALFNLGLDAIVFESANHELRITNYQLPVTSSFSGVRRGLRLSGNLPMSCQPGSAVLFTGCWSASLAGGRRAAVCSRWARRRDTAIALLTSLWTDSITRGGVGRVTSSPGTRRRWCCAAIR